MRKHSDSFGGMKPYQKSEECLFHNMEQTMCYSGCAQNGNRLQEQGEQNVFLFTDKNQK